MKKLPKNGLQGLVENWRSDFVAAISVALIALPLSIGIALAAGAPPMAGIFSAVIGGVVATLYSGSHISVNGPAKGVIGVILAALVALDDGSGQAFNYVLAAVVISGFLQMVLGLLKLGRVADIFHATVIHGILAAIGIIIFAKQIHVAMGTYSKSHSIIENLVDAVRLMPTANLAVVIISVMGALIIWLHPKIKSKVFQLLPTPMWVVAVSVLMAYLFDFFQPHKLLLLGQEYSVGPDLLLKMPESVMNSVMFPNFGKIDTIAFWVAVFSIMVITSIESLAIAKAVDKIDPYRRKTDLNRDLTGVGLSTMTVGLLGGLPIIAVIIRSTVNIHNGAQTKWSNLYQGLLLLIFVVALSPVMKAVPLCAFGILLVYTGFKLASPKVFKEMKSYGREQLIFFVSTMVLTLYTNLLMGLFGGLALVLIAHFIIAKTSIRKFAGMILKNKSSITQQGEGQYLLKLNGIVNFLCILRLNELLDEVEVGSEVTVDASDARLIGLTVLEHLYDFQTVHQGAGGTMHIIGLDAHHSSCDHRFAIKTKLSPT